MEELETRTNGNSEPRGFIGADLLQIGSGGHNPSTIFVKPGNKHLELLMRTVFKDEAEANANVLLYSKCVKFGFKRGLDDLMAHWAAKCSIKGRSTVMALMAEIQMMAPSLLGGTDKTQISKKQKVRSDEPAGNYNGR